MAAKTDKVSENERLTAEITADGNQAVAAEGTKQKLLEVVTAKITAMSTPQTSSNSSSGISPLGWIVLLMLALMTAVAIKNSRERAQNVH